MAVNKRPLFGVFFFKGMYLPQKLDLVPPFERQRNSVQKHVPSYLVEISPGWFVCAVPPLQRDGPYLIIEDNSLKICREVQNKVEYREECVVRG